MRVDSLQKEADKLLNATPLPSTSLLQVSLMVGYVRAKRLFETWKSKTEPAKTPQEQYLRIKRSHFKTLKRMAVQSSKTFQRQTTPQDVLDTLLEHYLRNIK
jgi:hypothetical protein